MSVLQEFDRQLDTLLQKGYHTVSHLSEHEFREMVEPLKKPLNNNKLFAYDNENGTLPFVIVISSDLVPTETAMNLVVKDGKNGITKLFPHTPRDFNTIESITIPTSKAYLLFDIDRGKQSLNVRPNEALDAIMKEGRSPLTIDEGVAIVTQFPQFLMKNNCFSLLASRHEGDQRVPAIWINGQKHPNLGWCWERNPHTWLGSASCSKRYY